MRPPLVSIILFAHAPYAKFIPQSLGSILAQSFESLEVLVLGDGSKELEAALDPYRRDPRCVPRAQGDLPFLQAANGLMRESRARYLGTWNSDDIYNADHVRVLVETLESDQDLGAAFDNTEYFTESSTDASGEYRQATSTLLIGEERGKRLAASRLSVQDIVRDNFMTGPSSLVRKSAFEFVGGYDKDIYLNCDLHWFYRLAAYFPVRYAHYVGVRKRVHALNNTAVNSHYEYGIREFEHIRDHYPDVYRRIGKGDFNKKLGRKYFRLGLYYQRTGEIEKAQAAYGEAMRLRKWSFRYHWQYFRSLRGS